MFLAIRNKLN